MAESSKRNGTNEGKIRIYSSRAGSENWQARTDWIEDPSGKPYQWAIADDGARFHIARRLMGVREYDTVQVIETRDLNPLAELLEAAQDHRLQG